MVKLDLNFFLEKNVKGWAKLSRTLGLNCGRKNIVATSNAPMNSESYACVLSIFILVIVMSSSYEELEGYKWEEVDFYFCL